MGKSSAVSMSTMCWRGQYSFPLHPGIASSRIRNQTVASRSMKRGFRRTIGRFCRSGVRSSIRNGYGYWAQLPTRSPGEHTALVKLAEGEELGSNLLRVAQSSPGARATLDWLETLAAASRALMSPSSPDRQTTAGGWRAPAGWVAPTFGTKLRRPRQAHPEAPDGLNRRARLRGVRRPEKYQAPASQPPAPLPSAPDPLLSS
jgi:hypothetical protein